MEELMNFSILKVILLESDMLRPVIGGYFYLIILNILTVLNILGVDKYEVSRGMPSCYKFKCSLPFIFTKSKDKHLIPKKTFIFEVIFYVLKLLVIVSIMISLYLSVKDAIYLMVIISAVDIIFGCVVARFYRKSRKDTEG